MRLVLISDTHNQHADLMLPKGDVLIHAGDVSGRGSVSEIRSFLDWFTALDFKHKVFVAGNHDFFFERVSPIEVQEMIPEGVVYLNDSFIEINGVKFWGSPITPWFYDWAFNRARGKEIQAHWELIPPQTDVLITHGPPQGILDRTLSGEQVGCADLLETIQEKPPKLHVFGHIHEGSGHIENNGTTFVNASVLDHRYNLVHEPFVFDLTEK